MKRTTKNNNKIFSYLHCLQAPPGKNLPRKSEQLNLELKLKYDFIAP